MTTTPTDAQMKLARECAAKAYRDADQTDALAGYVEAGEMDDDEAVQSALLAIQATEARMAGAVEWQDISTAPLDEEILAAITVKRADLKSVERHVIIIDSETGEIEDNDYYHGWDVQDYEYWQPLPAPPAIRSAHDGQG